MQFVLIEDSMDIYLNKEIYAMMELAVFNSTWGKIKSAAEAMYSKQQGLFFTAVEGDEIVGIIGVKRIDSSYLELNHLAVKPEWRKKGIARSMINEVLDHERVDTMVADVDHKDVEFFKHCGFKTKLVVDEAMGEENYVCTLKI